MCVWGGEVKSYFLSNVTTDTTFLSVVPILPPILPISSPPITVNATTITMLIDADISAVPRILSNLGI